MSAQVTQRWRAGLPAQAYPGRTRVSRALPRPSASGPPSLLWEKAPWLWGRTAVAFSCWFLTTSPLSSLNSFVFLSLFVNYLEKQIWELHSNVRGMVKPALVWRGYWWIPVMDGDTIPLSPLPPSSQCPSVTFFNGRGEKPQWSWHPQASTLSLQV